MSSENGSNKSEKPTPHKLRKSREDGQVAQSKEFTSLSGIVIIFILLFFLSKYYLGAVSDSYSVILRQVASPSMANSELYSVAIQTFYTMLRPFLSIIIFSAVVTFFVNMIQVNGIVFSKKFMELKFESLNPVDNFKNIFSKKNFIKFFFQFICVNIFAIVASYIIQLQFKNFTRMWHLDLKNILIYMGLVIAEIVCALLFIYLVYAIINLINEKRNLYKQLMMDHDEIKKETKEVEGDPEVKSERKKLYNELIEDDKLNDVMNNATFVLSNPTHIAIVVFFKPLKSPMPFVIAKAKDQKAKMIFNLAKKYKVPILRDIYLARKLYPLIEMGKPIPSNVLADFLEMVGKNLDLMPTLYDELQMRYKGSMKI